MMQVLTLVECSKIWTRMAMAASTYRRVNESEVESYIGERLSDDEMDHLFDTLG
jgi:hypothetical protein